MSLSTRPSNDPTILSLLDLTLRIIINNLQHLLHFCCGTGEGLVVRELIQNLQRFLEQFKQEGAELPPEDWEEMLNVLERGSSLSLSNTEREYGALGTALLYLKKACTTVRQIYQGRLDPSAYALARV